MLTSTQYNSTETEADAPEPLRDDLSEPVKSSAIGSAILLFTALLSLALLGAVMRKSMLMYSWTYYVEDRGERFTEYVDCGITWSELCYVPSNNAQPHASCWSLVLNLAFSWHQRCANTFRGAMHITTPISIGIAALTATLTAFLLGVRLCPNPAQRFLPDRIFSFASSESNLLPGYLGILLSFSAVVDVGLMMYPGICLNEQLSGYPLPTPAVSNGPGFYLVFAAAAVSLLGLLAYFISIRVSSCLRRGKKVVHLSAAFSSFTSLILMTLAIRFPISGKWTVFGVAHALSILRNDECRRNYRLALSSFILLLISLLFITVHMVFAFRACTHGGRSGKAASVALWLSVVVSLPVWVLMLPVVPYCLTWQTVPIGPGVILPS